MVKSGAPNFERNQRKGCLKMHVISNKRQFVVSNKNVKRFRRAEEKNIAKQKDLPKYDFSEMKRLRDK